MLQARKSGDKEALGLLSLILGDVATLKARTGKEVDENQIDNLIRSLFNKNSDVINGKDIDEEIAKVSGNDQRIQQLQELKKQRFQSDAVAKLQKENKFFSTLLPATLSIEEIKVVLAEISVDIKAAKNIGQATGVAMKFLKPKNLKVLGDDVKVAVEQMR